MINTRIATIISAISQFSNSFDDFSRFLFFIIILSLIFTSFSKLRLASCIQLISHINIRYYSWSSQNTEELSRVTR